MPLQNPAKAEADTSIRKGGQFMSWRGRLVFACLWILSLAIVASIASAQVRRDPAPVISGADFGFRPEGWQGKARTGTFVVRINGEWVDAVPAVKTAPATTR